MWDENGEATGDLGVVGRWTFETRYDDFEPEWMVKFSKEFGGGKVRPPEELRGFARVWDERVKRGLAEEWRTG